VNLCDELAKAFYPDECAQAESNTNLRKRVGIAYMERFCATKWRRPLRNPHQFRGSIKTSPIS
jgi:hypothetical protein